MISLVSYKDYDLTAPYAIIHELMQGPRTTSDLMKLRCKSKKMACVSTYVSKARRILAKTGSKLVCNKKGNFNTQLFTYSITND